MLKYKTGKRKPAGEGGSNKPELVEKKRSSEDFFRKLEASAADSLNDYCAALLSNLAKEMEIIQAALYFKDDNSTSTAIRFFTGYACNNDFTEELTFKEGEGLPGQVIKDRKIMKLENLPEGYITVKTGLGEASPSSLLIIPLIMENKIAGLIEIASFHKFSEDDESFLQRISDHLAVMINNGKDK